MVLGHAWLHRATSAASAGDVTALRIAAGHADGCFTAVRELGDRSMAWPQVQARVLLDDLDGVVDAALDAERGVPGDGTGQSREIAARCLVATTEYCADVRVDAAVVVALAGRVLDIDRSGASLAWARGLADAVGAWSTPASRAVLEHAVGTVGPSAARGGAFVDLALLEQAEGDRELARQHAERAREDLDAPVNWEHDPIPVARLLNVLERSWPTDIDHDPAAPPARDVWRQLQQAHASADEGSLAPVVARTLDVASGAGAATGVWAECILDGLEVRYPARGSHPWLEGLARAANLGGVVPPPTRGRVGRAVLRLAEPLGDLGLLAPGDATWLAAVNLAAGIPVGTGHVDDVRRLVRAMADRDARDLVRRFVEIDERGGELGSPVLRASYAEQLARAIPADRGRSADVLRAWTDALVAHGDQVAPAFDEVLRTHGAVAGVGPVLARLEAACGDRTVETMRAYVEACAAVLRHDRSGALAPWGQQLQAMPAVAASRIARRTLAPLDGPVDTEQVAAAASSTEDLLRELVALGEGPACAEIACASADRLRHVLAGLDEAARRVVEPATTVLEQVARTMASQDLPRGSLDPLSASILGRSRPIAEALDDQVVPDRAANALIERLVGELGTTDPVLQHAVDPLEGEHEAVRLFDVLDDPAGDGRDGEIEPEGRNGDDLGEGGIDM